MLNLGPTKEKRFFAALDLGQVSDFSTLAVIERIQLVGDWDPMVDLLRRSGLPCKLQAAIIAGGNFESESNGYHHIPKKDLIIGLLGHQERLPAGHREKPGILDSAFKPIQCLAMHVK